MRAAALPPGRNRQESRHGKAPPVHLHERRTRRPNRRSPALNRPRPKWKPSCESSSSTTGSGTLPRNPGSSTASRSRNYGKKAKESGLCERSAAIDIVLETMDRLFIGEAKLESALGSDSDHVLVHQLIRQYAMAHRTPRRAGQPGSLRLPGGRAVRSRGGRGLHEENKPDQVHGRPEVAQARRRPVLARRRGTNPVKCKTSTRRNSRRISYTRPDPMPQVRRGPPAVPQAQRRQKKGRGQRKVTIP